MRNNAGFVPSGYLPPSCCRACHVPRCIRASLHCSPHHTPYFRPVRGGLFFVHRMQLLQLGMPLPPFRCRSVCLKLAHSPGCCHTGLKWEEKNWFETSQVAPGFLETGEGFAGTKMICPEDMTRGGGLLSPVLPLVKGYVCTMAARLLGLAEGLSPARSVVNSGNKAVRMPWGQPEPLHLGSLQGHLNSSRSRGSQRRRVSSQHRHARSWCLRSMREFPSVAEKEKREKSILDGEGASSPNAEGPAGPKGCK